MKNSIKRSFWAILICGLGCFASCADMLDTESNSYLDTKDNLLNSANDSLYSVVGIVKQLQSLGDRYVLLGELRGELTEVTKNAGMDMQAVADFTATADNPYLSTREYYAVINNCNYFLQHVDTSIVSAGKKVMLGEYVYVKTIRAWTYLQLGLNFGKVTWLTEPVLDIDAMNRPYEELTLENLLPRLLTDLIPYLNVTDYPAYGDINGLPATASLIPLPVVLADLYMWWGACTGDMGAYEIAAGIYYRWFTVRTRNFYGACRYSNNYGDIEFRILYGMWNEIYGNLPQEYVSLIRYNNVRGETITVSPLTRMCFPTSNSDTYMIKPSQAAMSLWKNETYALYRDVQKDVHYYKGDLRGAPTGYSSDPLGSYTYASINEADSVPYITKYGYYLQGNNIGTAWIYNISLYRDGLLYLRYAEALNALGKPSLAFAVLKYGMKQEVLTNPAKISPDEINPLPYYFDFMDERFSAYPVYNVGIHSRGSGLGIAYDTIYYAFTPQTLAENRSYYGFPEKLENKADSMQFVHTMICKELGLETAFEGNRFHDLMRLSRTYQRLTGKSDFLAKWVARRNSALEAKLINPDNWYLPYKE